jgi:opacity protein-like surface antigen
VGCSVFNKVLKVLLCILFVNSAYAFPFYAGVTSNLNWWHESRNISGVQQSIVATATPNVKQNLKDRIIDAGLEFGVIAGYGDLFSLGLNLSADNQNVGEHLGYTQGGEDYSLNEGLGWVFNAALSPSVKVYDNWRVYGDIGVNVLEFKLKSGNFGGGYIGPTADVNLWRPGYTLGVGVESEAFQHFVFKFGYLYQDILPFSVTTNDPPPAGIPVGNYHIKSDYHLYSSGLAAAIDVIF